MKNNIILIGMRGSGKSTLGRQLSKNLNREFIETDRLVEKSAGKKIADIVTHDGWGAFRALEREACEQVCTTTTNAVIATGGGSIVDSKNRTQLKKSGLIVYLSATIETLIKRVARQPKRPMLTDAKRIEDDMAAVFGKRKELYEHTADIQLDVTDIPPINQQTKLCAIFGNPVSHSLSPKMHNSAYQKLGLDFAFLKIKAIDSQKAIEAIQNLELTGAVITIPFKQSIMKYLDAIDQTAKDIGAVNTIVNDEGVAKGTNTDWIGAIESLKGVTTIKGKTVAILGAGGAARAIAYGLKKSGANVVVFNRTKSHAEKLVKELGLNGYFDLSNHETMQQCNIIINTTSVGMEPYDDQSPIEQHAIHEKQLVYDIVYTPRITKLLQFAKTAKARILTGESMVLHGAVKQFELFTGVKAPIEVMREALC